MRTSKTIIHLILPAFILALVSVSFGQTPNSASQSKKSANPTRTHTVADRERFKIEGIVAKQDGKVLTLRGSDQKETVVAFTAETDFNWFAKVCSAVTKLPAQPKFCLVCELRRKERAMLKESWWPTRFA